MWLGAALAGCGAEQRDEVGLAQSRHGVISGVVSADFDYPLTALERNATLAQVVTYNGARYQGCSATLVGDRVVVSAGHCVVTNTAGWRAGAAPVVGAASMLSYVVGEDVDHPLCELAVERLRLNSEIAIQPDGSLIHDSAIAILDQSALASCPQAVPLMLNRQPVEPLVGQLLAQGGFGSLDGSTRYSKLKYWSALELSRTNDALVFGRNLQRGFPSQGDSGSGALLRMPDGSLRVLGTCSTTWDDEMGFSRLDKDDTFLDATLTQALMCGELQASGVCRGDTLVRCGNAEVEHRDCAAAGLGCVVGPTGAASCACTCNASALCQPSCACDTDCAVCACDTTEGCTDGCACDAACADAGATPPPAEAPPPTEAMCSTTGGLTSVLLCLALARVRPPPRPRRHARDFRA